MTWPRGCTRAPRAAEPGHGQPSAPEPLLQLNPRRRSGGEMTPQSSCAWNPSPVFRSASLYPCQSPSCKPSDLGVIGLHVGRVSGTGWSSWLKVGDAARFLLMGLWGPTVPNAGAAGPRQGRRRRSGAWGRGPPNCEHNVSPLWTLVVVFSFQVGLCVLVLSIVAVALSFLREMSPLEKH